MRKTPPSAAIVRSRLSYDRATGVLFWRVSCGTAKVGAIAGTPVHSRGKTYIYVKIDGSLYQAHHIAWFFEHSCWPNHDIDHADGDGTNNRAINLRACTMSQNKANSRRYKNNTSGAKGVSWNKPNKKWMAYISANHRRKFLGLFSSFDAAVAARSAAAHDLHGKFARAE